MFDPFLWGVDRFHENQIRHIGSKPSLKFERVYHCSMCGMELSNEVSLPERKVSSGLYVELLGANGSPIMFDGCVTLRIRFEGPV